ncbi:hypothetical protein [Alteromonas gilva]|uniref:Uncharacterized protein n=1 Tax=Alteromonas gilva TaxID=2987522 RepID=A0ABT5L1G2_9ALTE|nr:hypothetical protein [Alteromonas gilva]MDC8830881.1 hypothetical protein [Alteromonas gilva]
MMRNAIEYVFPNQPLAYRFLNTVKHFDAEKLVVKYGQTNHHVKVSYEIKTAGFDTTLGQLDDLADQMDGSEI